MYRSDWCGEWIWINVHRVNSSNPFPTCYMLLQIASPKHAILTSVRQLRWCAHVGVWKSICVSVGFDWGITETSAANCTASPFVKFRIDPSIFGENFGHFQSAEKICAYLTPLRSAETILFYVVGARCQITCNAETVLGKFHYLFVTVNTVWLIEQNEKVFIVSAVLKLFFFAC